MAKFNSLEEYIDTLNSDAKQFYKQLRDFILKLDDNIQERLFAGQVAYYIEKHLKRTFHESPVIVLSFYSDHVNVFAMANLKYKELLKEYKFTSKGTLQIYYDKELNNRHLPSLFIESLS
jgi:hypothetical protein